MNPYQNPYQNPHPVQPNVFQRPNYPQHPGMHPNQPPMQQVQQPLNIQIANTPQGPMYVNANTGQVLGPVNPPQQQMPPQVPQYPQHPQHQMPQYPQHMQPGMHPNMQPAYPQVNQPFNQAQPSVRQIPPNMHGGNLGITGAGNVEDTSHTDNRYGVVSNLIKPKEPLVIDVQPVVKPKEPTVVKEPVKAHQALKGTGYSPTYYSRALAATDVVVSDKYPAGGSLESLIGDVIDDAHSQDNKALVNVQSVIVINKFFGVDVELYEKDLYQSNIELVYKALKRILPEVKSSYDYAYFSAYNKWLTKNVNTFLTIHMKQTAISSFVEDFNDLIKYLINGHDNLRDMLIEHMTPILDDAAFYVKELRAVAEGEDASVVLEGQAAVPENYTVVYAKLLSSQIGDDASPAGLKVVSDLMLSVNSLIGKPSFTFVTMDKRVYKVDVKANSDISIDCISS